jgi:hypothetical protein
MSITPNVWRQNVKSTIGLDPVFGSSSFGIVVTQLYDQKIHVMFAEKYEHPSFQDMISKVWELKNKLGMWRRLIPKYGKH